MSSNLFMLFWGILFFGLISLKAHNNSNEYFHGSKNFSWSLSFSAMDEILPEGYAYSPLVFLGQYHFSRLGPFDLYVEGQFAGVSTLNARQFDFEAGLNLGFQFQLPIFSRLLFSSAVGSGPYWVTADTRRQADGFIFSDNFEMGLSYSIYSAQIQVRG